MKNSGVNIWLQAVRPKTLWAGISPVLIGTAMAYADSRFHLLSAVCAMAGAVLIQVGTNFANDYFDYKKGADTSERLGPLRVTQAGLVSPHKMKFAFIFIFLLSILPGLYLVMRGGWPILLIGLLSFLFGILYTGGPYPLGYNGLGELFVLLFFGFVAVTGTYYAQALRISLPVLFAGIAPGLFSSAILAVNNLRDIKTDKKTGKRTLAVRFGSGFTRIEYLFCIVAACVSPLFLIIVTKQHYYSLAAFIVAFLAIPSLKIVFSGREGEILNSVLASTGKYLFIYSILFSIGWIL